jgi:DNA-binding protein H-NS
MVDLLWIERGLRWMPARHGRLTHSHLPARPHFPRRRLRCGQALPPLRQSKLFTTIMSTLITRSDAETRERLILWIRKRMHEYGITVAALQDALEEDVDQTRYQDAFGNCWSGEGSLPEWLRRAVAA